MNFKGRLKGKTFMQKISFSYINSLLDYAQNDKIRDSAIEQIDKNLQSENTHQKLSEQFALNTLNSRVGIRLLKSLLLTFRTDLLYCFMILLLMIISLTLSPIITSIAIQQIQKRQQFSINQLYKNILLFLLILLILILREFTGSHLWYNYYLIGFNMTNSLSMMLYEKMLTYSFFCNKKYTISDILSFNEFDMEKVMWLGYNMTSAITVPLQLVLSSIILYIYIGNVFIPGMAIIIISSILVAYISHISSEKNKILIQRKDERMKQTEQVFNFIRFIKINDFNKIFQSKLRNSRNQQVIQKNKINILNLDLNFILWLHNALVISITFLCFVLMDQEITTSKAFIIIILFRNLQNAILQFPMTLTQSIVAWQSVKRIQNFLNEDQIINGNVVFITSQTEEINKQIYKNNYSWAVKFQGQSYSWEKQIQEIKSPIIKSKKLSKNKQFQKNNKQIQLPLINKNKFQVEYNQKIIGFSYMEQVSIKQTILKDINLLFKKSKLTMIIGDIGSGKSSLLYAILNQMESDDSKPILINGSLSFSSQKPWIMAGTLKQNIILTSEYEEQKFEKAVFYACLEEDLKSLPKGLQTEIGQKGINLSGGQKARISLARSLYLNKDIFLLDDILSAVDVHVGQFLIKQTFLGYLKQNNKTVIMPTHAVKYLSCADQIVIMKEGRVQLVGEYENIKNTVIFMQTINICAQLLAKQRQSMRQQQKKSQKIRKSSFQINQKTQRNFNQIPPFKNENKFSHQNYLENQKLNSQIELKKLETKQQTIQQFLVKQQTEYGTIKLNTYITYINLSGGFFLVLLVIILHIGWIVFSSLTNLVIQKWCNHLQQNDQQRSVQFSLLYMTLSISSSILIFLALIIINQQSKKLSTQIHLQAINSLFNAGLNSFFNRFSSGRIINRLSKDIGKIDSSLIDYQKLVYSLGFLCIGSISMCIYASSYLMIIPLVVIFYFLIKTKNYFMNARIQCTRFISTKNSKLLDGLITSLNGLTSIRAFKLQKDFLKNQFKRIDQNMKFKVARQAIEGSFATRIVCLMFGFTIPVILIALFYIREGPAIGIIMSYTIGLSELIGDFIQNIARLQNDLVSVENINHFIKLRPEEEVLKSEFKKTNQQQFTASITKLQILKNTNNISNGIQFNNVCLSYRKDLPNILESISFKVMKGEKIGIIGRTGAGKTTIFNSLLRIIDPKEGDIFINGIKSTQVNLNHLRSSVISIIDQDAVVFNASFKENIDPSDSYTQQEIIQTAKKCGIFQIIENRGGINAIISSESLSVGEKQLLSICRGFLRKAEIILIDEATANIDVKNDMLIHKAISIIFRKKTVLTIAHRISTLQNSDKILVLGDKRILEYGSPEELLLNKNGIYKSMLEKNDKQFLA